MNFCWLGVKGIGINPEKRMRYWGERNNYMASITYRFSLNPTTLMTVATVRIPHSPPLIVISVCFIYTLNNISVLGYPKTYPKNLGTTSRLSLTEGLVHRSGLRDL
jgi:hypothetical protein